MEEELRKQQEPDQELGQSGSEESQPALPSGRAGGGFAGGKSFEPSLRFLIKSKPDREPPERRKVPKRSPIRGPGPILSGELSATIREFGPKPARLCLRKRRECEAADSLAEGEGFEPPSPFRG